RLPSFISDTKHRKYSAEVAALPAVLAHPDRVSLQCTHSRESPMSTVDILVEARGWFAVHFVDEIDVSGTELISLAEMGEIQLRIDLQDHRWLLHINRIRVRVVVHDRVVRVFDTVARVQTLISGRELIVLLRVD
ncbi:hypothetical protein PMAYCL1PPCAC_22561, partial [Pristionchus mayeri]